MRYLIVYIALFITGCNKIPNDLNGDYEIIIGTWQEEDGEANSSYEFKKSGKIIFKQGIDRGFSIKIDRYILIKTDPINGWKRYAVEYKNSIYYHLSYSISPTNDSLWAAGSLLDDEGIQQQTKQYYTRVQ